jgi:hypothetical protein
VLTANQSPGQLCVRATAWAFLCSRRGPGGSNTYSGGTTIDAGTLELAASGAAGSGPITIETGSTLVLAASGAASSDTIAFGGPSTLNVEAAALPASGGTFSNTIDNFAAGDNIDIAGLAYNTTNLTANTATFSGDVLTLSNGTATHKFDFGGTVPTGVAVTSDGSGGTEIFGDISDAITKVDTATSGNHYIDMAGNETETAKPDRSQSPLRRDAHHQRQWRDAQRRRCQWHRRPSWPVCLFRHGDNRKPHAREHERGRRRRRRGGWRRRRRSRRRFVRRQ